MSSMDKYKRGASIGSGGFGKVYSVERIVDGVQLAMKEQIAFHEDESKMEEVRHMLGLEHKNIVSCVDFFTTTTTTTTGKTKWTLHILMPLYSCDLDKLVRNEGGIGKQRCIKLVAELGEALCFLHKRGFIHRDVKPPNVMVCSPGGDVEFVLADLGLSKEALCTNSYTGTPHYMAPDILSPPYTNKVDLWSLGVTACFAVFGEDDGELMLRHLHGNYEFVIENVTELLEKSVGAPLDGVLLRLLSMEADDRPAAEDIPLLLGERVVLLACVTIGGDERKRKIAVSKGADEDTVRKAISHEFRNVAGMEEISRLEILDEDFNQFVDVVKGTEFKEKNTVRVVCAAVSSCDPPHVGGTNTTTSTVREDPTMDFTPTDSLLNVPVHEGTGVSMKYMKHIPNVTVDTSQVTFRQEKSTILFCNDGDRAISYKILVAGKNKNISVKPPEGIINRRSEHKVFLRYKGEFGDMKFRILARELADGKHQMDRSLHLDEDKFVNIDVVRPVLVTVAPDPLTFDGEGRCDAVISNNSDKWVAYKLRILTNRKFCKVRPTMGVLSKGAKTNVQFIAKSDPEESDALRILSKELTEDQAAMDDQELAKIWKECSFRQQHLGVRRLCGEQTDIASHSKEAHDRSEAAHQEPYGTTHSTIPGATLR